MSKNALLKSLVILLVLIAGCQDEGEGQPVGGGRSFVGGNSGLSMDFIENSPPREIFDGNQFPFQVLVLYENVGESNIPEGKARFTLSGIYHEDFGVKKEALEQFNTVYISGVQKDPDGNKIRGGVHQQKFPVGSGEFSFRQVITGNQEFPLRLDACYEYSTLAISSICIRENIAQPGAGVCRITGTRDVSNSGAPVRVTSVKEGVGGSNTVLINFRVEKSGNGEIYLPGIYIPRGTGGPDCPSDYNKRNRVHVTVSTGDPVNDTDPLNANLICTGLVTDKDSKRSGELILTGGAGSFSCVQNIPDEARVNAVKGIQVKLEYQVKESITTRILVKSQFTGDDRGVLYPTQPVSSPEDLPDLSVQKIEDLPSDPTGGEEHTITADISNIGQIKSPETIATLELRVRGSRVGLGTYIIDSIDPGETLKARMRFDLPEKLASGDYYFYVRVNPQSTFNEIDNENNEMTSQLLYINEG